MASTILLFAFLTFVSATTAIATSRSPKDFLFIEDPDLVDPSKYITTEKYPKETLASPSVTTTVIPKVLERHERQIPMVLPLGGLSGLQGLGGFAGLSSGFNYQMSSCDKLKMYLAMVGQAQAIETTQIADQCIVNFID